MAPSEAEKKSIGECPLCGRPMVEGPSINEHHLLPKTFKGRETISIHKICHSKIHSVFTERELYVHYHTVERLLEHPEIQKFVNWVAKKDAEFMDRNRATRQKSSRRKYK